MRTVLVVIVLLTARSARLKAQEVTGALVGRVLSTTEQPLSGVAITASMGGLTPVRSALSDARGYFHVPALPAGGYTILVRQVGYRPIEFREVVVQLGRTTTLGDVKLGENPLELPEVVVMGDRPLIDPTTTTAGGNLTSDAFQALPVDRNFRSLVALFASANASFLGDETNIGGATGQENAYYIDGVDVTDPLKARTSTNLPYNFVHEIQVKTGGYEAEFGRALSGIVNVVTETGGNEFRGNIFGFYTGSGLAGAARRGLLETDVAASSGYDVGANVSGPLRRDRLWLFASYDLDRLTQDVPVFVFGTQTDKRTAHLFTGKLTWRPGPQTDVSFTVLGDPTTHDAIGPAEFAQFVGAPTGLGNVDPFRGRIEEGGVTLAAQARRFVGRQALLEGSVSRVARTDRRLGAEGRSRSEPTTIDVRTGRWSGGWGAVHDDRSVRTAATLTGTLDIGRHAWKAGAEVEDNRLDFVFGATEPGIIIHLPNDTFSVLYLSQVGHVRTHVVSLFLQDSWHLSDVLRLNTGLRWDGQYIWGADGRRAQSITNQLAPRIGAIAQLPTAAVQTLSLWFGRFYEQLPGWFAAVSWIPVRHGFYFYSHDPTTGAVPYDSLDQSSGIPPDVPGLRGQYLDEWAAGYDRLTGTHTRLAVRAVHRGLGEVIDNGSPDPTVGTFYVGNPGRGNLSFLPRLKREYNALEITVERRGGRRANFLASYVFSASRGNYTGLYASDVGLDFPNDNRNPDFPQQVPNSMGYLPNDRRHVFKLAGSWAVGRGLRAGTVVTWQSGAPLSELGAIQNWQAQHVFLTPRGTVGRTPALLDVNLRLTYEPAAIRGTQPRVMLDLFHVLSARRPVTFDQIHYLSADAAGNQFTPNPNYLVPTRYQPPMSARLGLEVGF